MTLPALERDSELKWQREVHSPADANRRSEPSQINRSKNHHNKHTTEYISHFTTSSTVIQCVVKQINCMQQGPS
jgi:hypothetical protein